MPTQLAWVLFDEVPTLTIAALQPILAAHWPDRPRITETTEEEAGGLSFQWGPVRVLITPIRVPVPGTEMEAALIHSPLWPDATEPVRKHRCHVIVAVLGDLSPAENCAVLTRAMMTVMEASPAALGAWWPYARHLVRKDIFCKLTTELLPDGPPWLLWVQFRTAWVEVNQRSAGHTVGLAPLGLMEIEAPESHEAPSRLRDRFTGLAQYLFENGLIIACGNTIGEDDEERIRVRHTESSFGAEGTVLQLVYEQALPTASRWKRLFSSRARPH